MLYCINILTEYPFAHQLNTRTRNLGKSSQLLI